MTDQVLRRLFDYQRFARCKKLDVLIQDTQSRQAVSLSESELSYVNAAGIPEIMGMVPPDPDDKDGPWNQS